MTSGAGRTPTARRDRSFSTRSLLVQLALIGAGSAQGFAAEVPTRAAHAAPVASDSPAPVEVRSAWRRLVTLEDYNSRMVLAGTVLLGMSAGIVGTFVLLRRRALVGDVVSHAALPGIAVAFLVMEFLSPGRPKPLAGLLCGAAVSGGAGMLLLVAIRRWTRIRDDAAMAVVLGTFFGAGVALFTAIQRIPGGHAAGLQQFVYGSTAGLAAGDVGTIACGALVVLVAAGMLFKELTVLCFDESYAAVQGWPTGLLDAVLMILVTGTIVIGLQSVGLILVVAILVTPAAAARFWSDRLGPTTVLAAAIGGLSAAAGTVVSALLPRIAAGAVIVLAGSTLFAVSFLCGTQRGLLVRWVRRTGTARRIGRDDVLRAFYEVLEGLPDAASSPAPATRTALDDPTWLASRAVPLERLQARRSWTPARLDRLLRAARRAGLAVPVGDTEWRLTAEGADEARRAVRNHRLWELYLIRHADVAPGHVDRDADRIEHVLEPEIVAELERLLRLRAEDPSVPPSPHALRIPPAKDDGGMREAG